MKQPALKLLLALFMPAGDTLIAADRVAADRVAADRVAADRPNILFLLTDDMRPDCISALGNPHIRTPNLDYLVERGLTFTRATYSYPICIVSRAELLTGRHG